MNINNLKIRNAKINDIEKILEIENNSFDKNIWEDKKDFYEICILKEFFDYNNIEPFKVDGIIMRKFL